MNIQIVLIFISSLCGSLAVDVTCKNEIDGQSLDWFVLYKLPVDCSTGNPGTNYIFANSKTTKLKLSSKTIDQKESLPGQTLALYYQARQDKSIGYILYSDQAPTDSNTTDKDTRAHAKGIVLISEKLVTFVSHSIPRYPPVTAYTIDSSQCKYGQSMICVSMKIDQLPALAIHFAYLYPNVYDYYLPSWLSTSHPTEYDMLNKIVTGKRVTKEQTKTQKIVSMAKKNFDLHSKSSYFGQDLYSGLVASYYKSPLMVESWLNGIGTKMNSSCTSSNSVVDIKEVKPTETCTFSSSKDHSKWTVSMSSTNPVVCIGDINRMESQNSRGGGTLCIPDADLTKQYTSIINAAGECPK